HEAALVKSISRHALAGGYGKICSVMVGDVPAAAVLFLYDDRTAYYMFGANDPAYRNTAAGTLALMNMIKDAHESGLKEVDFVAVDPLRRNLEAVRQKLEQASCTRFDLCEVALSENAGKVEFFTNRDTALSGHDSLLDMRTIGYGDPVDCIEVDTDTLDNLAA